MSIGDRMKQRRNEMGLSADDLAKAIGVNRSTVFRYEKGDIEKKPIDVVNQLAKILQTTPEWLMGWEDEPQNIVFIYNQLERPRQQKVCQYAEHQLEEQKSVRLYGQVAANPEAMEYVDETYEEYIVDEVPPNADGALVVHGDSMEPEYENGSIVFYKSQPDVENGQLAVVEVDGSGVTFKKFYRDYNHQKIILKSINDKKYSDRTLDPNRVKVIGIVLN